MGWYVSRLTRKAHTDMELAERLFRVIMMEEPPTSLFRPGVMGRVLKPSIHPISPPNECMSNTISQPGQVVRDFVAWENGDFSKVDVVSESLDIYNPGLDGGEVHDRESYAAYLEKGRSAFPDMQIAIEEMVANEDTVMAEVRITGTHEGEFKGLPSTGQSVDIRGMGRFLISDGTVEKCHIYYNSQEMANQLGITFPEILGQLPKLILKKLKLSG
ncbi:ester cyclase [Haloarcula nitratireducens]|uniref:Ester cyclase n=1 Tax=Haloarcula nitratireducens TaxID=2487749 RepID=A0AAW4PKY3_9EURY|nr:ester cyclase [Halomicroarcula nitratireducens]MBX0298030.1 ester cyclase [Halomicroarcula nitratireducens]